MGDEVGQTTDAGAAGDDRPGRVAGAADRYVLLDPLGAGGTANVYAAFDRTLDRKVAIKLLRDASLEGRLLREAQALARVRHPNVVAVHDAGMLGDRVFLAMELVSGRSLRGWLEAEARGWRAILAVFVAAGRGLCAVHAAGLVHRDFKPDNVLIGDDGTVRIADFGLVRLTGDAMGTSAESSPMAVHLTATGSVVGTPRYMPPEQHAGGTADARSDQFSFCASLYHALYAQAPFAGDTVAELRDNVLAGRLRAPPAERHVPGWLARAVRRGLATKPADRWPSLAALVDHLNADRGRPWRRAAAVVAILGCTAALVVGLRGNPSAPACGGAAARLAGAWDAERRAAVEKGFLATGLPYASDTSARVARHLDNYAAAWAAMHEETCAATAVRHEQSQELLDLRMTCLDERRGELAALVTAFAAAPDRAVVDGAVSATGTLGDLAACADRRALAARDPLPTHPRTRALFLGLRARIGVVVALSAVKSIAAAPLGVSLADEARALGFPSLEAEAGRALGEAYALGADTPQAIASYERGIVAARQVRDPHLAVSLLTSLAVTLSTDRRQAEQAVGIARATEATLAALGGDANLEALLVTTRSRDPRLATEERLQLLERAVALQRKTDDKVELGSALAALGVAYRKAHRPTDSLRCHLESLVLFRAYLGDRNPMVSGALSNVATFYLDREQYAKNRELLSEAVAIQETGLGDHAMLATLLYNVAIADSELGELDRADAENARSLAIREKIFGPEHANLASPLWRRARIAEQRGHTAAAIPDYRRARDLLTKAGGPADPKALEVTLYLAAALAGVGDCRAALAEVGAAQPALDAQPEPDPSLALQARLVQGECALAGGDGRRALTLLEPALALGDAPPPRRWLRARALFAAARALVAARREPGQAVALARRARAIWVEEHDALLPVVDAWLAARL